MDVEEVGQGVCLGSLECGCLYTTSARALVGGWFVLSIVSSEMLHSVLSSEKCVVRFVLRSITLSHFTDLVGSLDVHSFPSDFEDSKMLPGRIFSMEHSVDPAWQTMPSEYHNMTVFRPLPIPQSMMYFTVVFRFRPQHPGVSGAT